MTCNLCLENGKPAHKWIKPKPYSGEVGKLIITHDCKSICRGYTLIVLKCSVREADYKFPLTQAYVDWVRKHKKSFFTPECHWGLNMCHECRIKELEQDISFNPDDQEFKENNW